MTNTDTTLAAEAARIRRHDRLDGAGMYYVQPHLWERILAALTKPAVPDDCCKAERARCAKIVADSAAMFRKLGLDARAHDLEFEVARIRNPDTAIRGADQ